MLSRAATGLAALKHQGIVIVLIREDSRRSPRIPSERQATADVIHIAVSTVAVEQGNADPAAP
jgi:hypothetical protein